MIKLVETMIVSEVEIKHNESKTSHCARMIDNALNMGITDINDLESFISDKYDYQKHTISMAKKLLLEQYKKNVKVLRDIKTNGSSK